jgi:MHS family proline/betaine transporter-like MFS transporter
LLQHATFVSILLAQLCFAVLLCLTYAPIPAELVELFDTNIRYSAMALPYNVSNAVFGGTAPLAATYLISITNNLLSPSFYLIFAASVMLFCLVFLKESYMKVL